MKDLPDWADLPYFLAVVREGSLRAAATRLGTTHATVSRHLESLERLYGTRLLTRSTEGLSLTLAGESLLPIARQAENAILDARRRLRGLDREAAGRIRVSLPPGLAYILLPDILAAFAAAHPAIDLQVTSTPMVQDLVRNEVDVSIRVAHQVDDNVIGRKLLQYDAGIFASKDYIDQHLPTAGPLGEGLTWLGWGTPEEDRKWLRESPFPEARLRHASPDGFMHLTLALRGMGMTTLPCFARSFGSGLQQVPGTETYPDRSIWLLLHSDLKDSLRVRLFVDFVAAEVKKAQALFITGRAH